MSWTYIRFTTYRVVRDEERADDHRAGSGRADRDAADGDDADNAGVDGRSGPGISLRRVGAVLAVGRRRHRAGVGDVLRHVGLVRDGADRGGLVARGGG